MTVLLKDVKTGKSHNSYIAGVYGVLKGALLFDHDIDILMGMTGMAFQFIVHDRICPSSVTVYDWQSEHFAMADRIGVCSEVFHQFNSGTLHTFEHLQKKAEARIKKSIDRGIGVVIWAPSPILEFGIINGYDDEDKVFHIDCSFYNPDPDPLLYSNLGRSSVPFLSYQIFYKRIELKPETIYRSSLEHALYLWRNTDNHDLHYSRGLTGYGNLIAALKNNDYIREGLPYILMVYGGSKTSAGKYLRFVAENHIEFRELTKAADLYDKISEIYEKASSLAPFPNHRQIDQNTAVEIAELMTRSRDLETEAMAVIQSVIED